MSLTLEQNSPKSGSEVEKPKLPNEKSQAEIVQHCNKLFNEARLTRSTFERQWYLNLAFYFGKQWVQWVGGNTSDVSRLHEPSAPPWRVRLVSNRIRPICRAEMAKITKEKPSAFVIPASNDDDDLAAARAAEAIWEHQYRTLRVQRSLRRMSFWMVTCGTGFIKDWWDSSYRDANTHGRSALEPVTPFHLFVPDLQEEEIEFQPHIIHVRAADPDWVYRMFKKDVPADSNASGDALEQRFLSAVGIQNGGKKYVSLKEFWCKPCKMFPDGALVTLAGDVLLNFAEGAIHKHGEYPVTKFEHVPTGRFYGDSVINDLIPIQKEFNRTRSQLIEAKNRMAKPQLIAQRGSIDTSKVTSEPGLIIQYTPGYQPPTPLPLTAMPAYVTQELDRCQADMDDISSQHEVSRGQTPPGVSAATAISFLNEQDETKLAFSIASIEEGCERIGGHLLSHADQFWESERMIRVVGDNGTYETMMFSQKHLKSNTDLKIEAGSAMPTSLAAKQAFITELGKMGWVQPQQAMRYLGLAETGRMYEDLTIDLRHQERENLRMARGEEVPVNTWDNDAAHIEALNTFRKKQQFEYLPDATKELFERHYMLHMQRMASKQGTPTLPGEPVPPPPGGDGAPGGPPPPGGGGPPGGSPMPPPPMPPPR